MNDPQQPDNDVAAEFRNLGKNLVGALRAVMDNSDWKKLQQDIEHGVTDFGATVKQEVDSLVDTPAFKGLKNDIDDLHQRIRTGDAEAKVREELISVLRTVNTELTKATSRWSGGGAQTAAGQPPVAEPPPAPEPPGEPPQGS